VDLAAGRHRVAGPALPTALPAPRRRSDEGSVNATALRTRSPRRAKRHSDGRGRDAPQHVAGEPERLVADGVADPRRPRFRSNLIVHRAIRKGMVRRYDRSDRISSMSAPAALGHGSRLEQHPGNHYGGRQRRIADGAGTARWSMVQRRRLHRHAGDPLPHCTFERRGRNSGHADGSSFGATQASGRLGWEG
jgi:hypothetical protein